jgi:hypothetical protein
MEEATEDDDDKASISTENVREDPNLNDTFFVRRKVAKRTLPWDLSVDELELVTPPQAEDTPATKRPRLEEPFSSTDEATTTISSHVTTVTLPPPNATTDHVDSDPVMGMQPNTRAAEAPKEDEKLTGAFANISEKKWGKEYRTDWTAVAVLVPGKTLHSSSDRTPLRTGRWTTDEDDMLKIAVKTHGGRWTTDEDDMLKVAVKIHGGKNWLAIAALVPGRTKKQCCSRWGDALDPNIDRANERTGKWSEDEGMKVKDAVQTHGAKDWDAIAALVSGRTKIQCRNRWHDSLDPNIDPTTVRAGKWGRRRRH